MDIQLIETELVKANITDQVIKKLREDYLGLKVKDTTDIVGFSTVQTARKETKKFRISVEKILKSVREPAVAFQKAVIAKEKDVVAQISEVENYLSLQEDIFNGVKEEVVTPKTLEEIDVELFESIKKTLLLVNNNYNNFKTIAAQEKFLKINTALSEVIKLI